MPRLMKTAPAALSVMVVLTLALGVYGVQAARAPGPLQLPGSARVGVVNLLDAEVTHFHHAPQLQDSFLKTHPVNWSVGAMLLSAVTDGLTRRGLIPVALAADESLRRLRETCFLTATLAKGLPKECVAPFAQLAASDHVAAIIVLGPGVNDSAHAGATRHRELPEYLRGWCVVSGEGDSAAAPVLLINLTELLLIGIDPKGATLAAREWGGGVAQSWSGYAPGTDLKALPDAQLNQLQPLFSALLTQQAQLLLEHTAVAP
jgi:hypothetical protein